MAKNTASSLSHYLECLHHNISKHFSTDDLNSCSGQDSIISKDGQSCYHVHRTPAPWHEAYMVCRSLGHSLIELKDEEVHVHLINGLGATQEKEELWIGFTNRKWETHPGLSLFSFI